MSFFFKQAFALLILVTLFGCSTGKFTTTERTALERALLSESAEMSLMGLENPGMRDQAFYLETGEFEAVDEEYIISALRGKLLSFGMKVVDNKEDADLVVYPRSAIANMDESEALIGIPELPMALPGIGAMKLPELALFKRFSQRGHSKIGVYGVEQEENRLAFDLGRSVGSRYYTRWTVLFLITFATTDLPQPYSKRTLEERADKEQEKKREEEGTEI